MLIFYKKYWRTAFDIALIVLTVYLIMYAFSFLYRIAAPVFLSLLIFAMIEPLARRLHRFGIKKSIASALSILFFSLIVVGAFVLAGIVLINELTALVERLPLYQVQFQQGAEGVIAFVNERLALLPEDVTARAQDLIGLVTDWGTQLAAFLLNGLLGFLSSFSTFIFNFLIGIVLAYFLSIEINDWKKTAADKTPRTFKNAFYFLKDNVLTGIAAYLKAQLKLISVTFIVVLIALLILGVDNAFTIAVIAAIFDVLPLLGVSTVFIPWIIYLFLVGQTTLAIWLTVLLGVILLVRQVLEPKITGDSLGVSAFTTLVFMIISLSLFGVAGVILSPILVILLKALYDQGYLHRWIRKPQDEYDEPLRTGAPPASGPHGEKPGGS